MFTGVSIAPGPLQGTFDGAPNIQTPSMAEHGPGGVFVLSLEPALWQSYRQGMLAFYFGNSRVLVGKYKEVMPYDLTSIEKSEVFFMSSVWYSGALTYAVSR